MQRFAYIVSLAGIFVAPSFYAFSIVESQIDLMHVGLFLVSITILGFVWDVWATRHGKKDSLWLWQFNHQNTIGIKVFDLPIEEVLFYTFSSFYVIMLWEGIQFGYASESYIVLVSLVSMAIWSCLFLILSFKLSGYDR